MGSEQLVENSVCDGELRINWWQFFLVFEGEYGSDEWSLCGIGLLFERELIQGSKCVSDDGERTRISSSADKRSGSTLCKIVSMIYELSSCLMYFLFSQFYE